jgi:hypothetical protein
MKQNRRCAIWTARPARFYTGGGQTCEVNLA